MPTATTSPAPIIVVSGLPRSGTSMMMKMLAAGGLPIFHDGLRQADADNPKGYYESQRVKDLACDASWLAEAAGQGIKIISSLLTYLPNGLNYKILFMRRDMEEVLSSQKTMLQHAGLPPSPVSDAVMAAKFSLHLRKITRLLEQRGIACLDVPYARVIAQAAEQAAKVNDFLGGGLDVRKMIEVVDTTLYRQRG